jgi:hypothetical protein
MCLFGAMATAASVDFKMGWNYGGGSKIKYQLENGDWQIKTSYGGNFGSFSGRNGVGATLGDIKLDAAYCIDLFHSIGLNGNYKANVTRNGIIADRGEIRNAGQIAWLMTNQAKKVKTLNQQAGFQAAIWEQVYGDKFELVSTGGAVKDAYDGYIAALSNNIAAVSSVLWIDPYSKTKKGKYKSNQDIVALAPTPIPAAFWLFGSGIIGLVGVNKRKNTY